VTAAAAAADDDDDDDDELWTLADPCQPPRYDNLLVVFSLVLLIIQRLTTTHSVGIDLKELGGQMLKCLKFCIGIEILNRFSLKNERL